MAEDDGKAEKSAFMLWSKLYYVNERRNFLIGNEFIEPNLDALPHCTVIVCIFLVPDQGINTVSYKCLLCSQIHVQKKGSLLGPSLFPQVLLTDQLVSSLCISMPNISLVPHLSHPHCPENTLFLTVSPAVHSQGLLPESERPRRRLWISWTSCIGLNPLL